MTSNKNRRGVVLRVDFTPRMMPTYIDGRYFFWKNGNRRECRRTCSRLISDGSNGGCRSSTCIRGNGAHDGLEELLRRLEAGLYASIGLLTLDQEWKMQKS